MNGRPLVVVGTDLHAERAHGGVVHRVERTEQDQEDGEPDKDARRGKGFVRNVPNGKSGDHHTDQSYEHKEVAFAEDPALKPVGNEAHDRVADRVENDGDTDGDTHQKCGKPTLADAGKRHRTEGRDVGRNGTGDQPVPEVTHTESEHIEFSDSCAAMVIGKPLEKVFDFSHIYLLCK